MTANPGLYNLSCKKALDNIENYIINIVQCEPSSGLEMVPSILGSGNTVHNYEIKLYHVIMKFCQCTKKFSLQFYFCPL